LRIVIQSTQKGFDLAQASREGRRQLSEAFLERFVIQENIEHYRAMLKITTDLERREVIEKLLLEEEAKLRKYDDSHKTK
jgi:hypothetical protein